MEKRDVVQLHVPYVADHLQCGRSSGPYVRPLHRLYTCQTGFAPVVGVSWLPLDHCKQLDVIQGILLRDLHTGGVMYVMKP